MNCVNVFDMTVVASKIISFCHIAFKAHDCREGRSDSKYEILISKHHFKSNNISFLILLRKLLKVKDLKPQLISEKCDQLERKRVSQPSTINPQLLGGLIYVFHDLER